MCIVVYICQESGPRNLSRATRLSFYSKMKCTHDFQESQNEVLVHFANVQYISVLAMCNLVCNYSTTLLGTSTALISH